MMIKVDKKVPIPDIRYFGGAPLKYPWGKLAVGDSFFVKTNSRQIGCQTTIKRLGIKITQRAVTEDGVKGLRIWRIT